MKINIPYGEGSMCFDASDGRVKAVLMQKENAERDIRLPEAFVAEALESPIGTPRLSELATGKKNITIITSDHTRPMPSAVTMPLLLKEVRKGAPDANILILIATGLHRATTQEEITERFGAEICRNENIIVHDCHDEKTLRHVGTLPSGGALVVSKYAADTDLLVAEGFIEPHFFAGFSGGRKSVFPGIAGYECVVSNHCSEFVADANATAGVLKDNPIHRDMEFAAEQTGLSFILNVRLGKGGAIVDAVAGHPSIAHEEGCRRLMENVSVQCVRAPIVVTSNGGYPLDQNLYQLVKCMETAGKCCEEGGIIIAVGECRDGAGGEAFYRDFAGGDEPRVLTERFLSRNRTETQTDQWQSQILARILEKHNVIVVAPLIEGIVKDMGLGWAGDIESALGMADAMLERKPGGTADIVAIPDGPGVVIL
ncbi:MAG: nickel-dependent lactate racemase [Clostridiales bacterium]|nr:nickel-dependent lactate racemase [Clostridiales bacterium]